MISKKSVNFRKIHINSCKTCIHVFTKTEYDDANELFCTLLNPDPRPKCGSVLMGEKFNFTWDQDYDKDPGVKEMHEWDKWSEKNEVSSSHICDKYDSGKSKK